MAQSEDEHKKQLIAGYLEGKASEKELMAFFGLVHRRELDELIGQYMDGDIAAIRQEIAAQPVVTRFRWRRWAAAAAAVFVLGTGTVLLIGRKFNQQQVAQNAAHDIAPGHNQATLTLVNGKKIILAKGLSGLIATEGSTTVRADTSAITYHTGGKSQAVTYNTLSTKRGEASPFPLVLSDGTKVWLNAASTLTFPASFNGSDREVTLTGEGYFEVAHHEGQPFRVKTAGQTIEDIGTAFDVNAYDDEPASKTTLVSGSVRINGQAVLRPGQQAELRQGRLMVEEADITAATAWRSGNFHFTDTRLSEILRQAARWYDVDIVYQDEALKNKSFGAITTRYAEASQLLHVLELTGEVKFQIEGRKITVKQP